MSKISLRTLHHSDRFEITRFLDNPKIFKNVRDHLPQPYTIQDAINFIDLVSKEDPQCTFAIQHVDHFVGVIGLKIQDDVHRKSAEIGYWIGEPFWGKGIASNAIHQMVSYGFEYLDINRIFAATYEYNLASMHVLEKNGFIKEGILRKAVLKNGAFHDEHRFAILKEEFQVRTTD